MSSKDIRKFMNTLTEETSKAAPKTGSLIKTLNESISEAKDTFMSGYNFAANQLVPQFGFQESIPGLQFNKKISDQYRIIYQAGADSLAVDLVLYDSKTWTTAKKKTLWGKPNQPIDMNIPKYRDQVLNLITQWTKQYSSSDPVMGETLVDEHNNAGLDHYRSAPRYAEFQQVAAHLSKEDLIDLIFSSWVEGQVINPKTIRNFAPHTSGVTEQVVDEAEKYKMGVTVLVRSMAFDDPADYAKVKAIDWPYGVGVKYDDASREVSWKTAKMLTVARLLDKVVDFGAVGSAVELLDLPSELAGHARHGSGYVTPHARRKHGGV